MNFEQLIKYLLWIVIFGIASFAIYRLMTTLGVI